MRLFYRFLVFIIIPVIIITAYIAFFNDATNVCPDESLLREQLDEVRDHISTARRQFDTIPPPCDAQLFTTYENTKSMLQSTTPSTITTTTTSITPIAPIASADCSYPLYACIYAAFATTCVIIIACISYYFRVTTKFSTVKRHIISYHHRILYNLMGENKNNDLYDAILRASSEEELLEICRTVILSIKELSTKENIVPYLYLKKTLTTTIQECEESTDIEHFLYNFEKLSMMLEYRGYLEFVYRYGADNMKKYFFEMIYYQLYYNGTKMPYNSNIHYNRMEKQLMLKDTIQTRFTGDKYTRFGELYAFQHNNYTPYELQMMRYLLLYIHKSSIIKEIKT